MTSTDGPNLIEYHTPTPRPVLQRLFAGWTRCAAIVLATIIWMVVAMWVCQALEDAQGLWAGPHWDLYIALIEQWPLAIGTLAILANAICTLGVFVKYTEEPFYWLGLAFFHLLGVVAIVMVAVYVTAPALYP